MKWNVYYYNINRRKIEMYNIFEHGGFVGYVKRHLRGCEDKDEFEEKLHSELHYYFWAKAEWEVIISPWVDGDREKDAVKIDVYSQVMSNWDIFIDYVWNNKKELLKIES